ncbi:MAG: efflux transporter outer membrane subunit [Nevskia sp.]|nr:efflux transporter outer membrane subunit [Nevskia sp.]
MSKLTMLSLNLARHRWPWLFLSACLSSCALMHDSGAPVPQIQPDQIRVTKDIPVTTDAWPRTKWWTMYGDSQLDALVEYALQHAPDAQIARQRVEQARAQTQAVKGGSQVQAALLGAVDRERVSADGFLGPFAQDDPAAGLTGPWYTQGIVGIGGSYKIDLWGEERSRISAAVGVQNARLAEAYAVELEISADVSRLYFGIQTLQQKAALLRQAQTIQSAVVASHRAHIERGLESATPSAEAENVLLQTQQQLTALDTATRQLREVLRALIGAHADDMPAIEPAPLPQGHTAVPRELSYQLMARRPDLQAMRWYVQASLDQVDAAKAMFYPSFDIKAFFGSYAIHMADLWTYHSQQIDLVPGLSLPIFDGGQLNANLRNSRAASNIVIDQYNEAVLDAVRDVAQAGTLLEGLDKDERLQHERVAQARIVEGSTQARFQRGLLSNVKSMEARLPTISQEAELVDIQGRQLAAEVQLIKALGGGFDGDSHAITDGAGRRPKG